MLYDKYLKWAQTYSTMCENSPRYSKQEEKKNGIEIFILLVIPRTRTFIY